MPTSRVILCAVYGLIALAALIATWSQNLAYFDNSTDVLGVFGAFLVDLKVNPAARSIAADIALVFLGIATFMVIEARKHGVRFVWAYILGGLFVAISVTLPLFLIGREMRLATSDADHLRSVDVVLLAGLTALVALLTVWLDAM